MTSNDLLEKAISQEMAFSDLGLKISEK